MRNIHCYWTCSSANKGFKIMSISVFTDELFWKPKAFWRILSFASFASQVLFFVKLAFQEGFRTFSFPLEEQFIHSHDSLNWDMRDSRVMMAFFDHQNIPVDDWYSRHGQRTRYLSHLSCSSLNVCVWVQSNDSSANMSWLNITENISHETLSVQISVYVMSFVCVSHSINKIRLSDDAVLLFYYRNRMSRKSGRQEIVRRFDFPIQ